MSFSTDLVVVVRGFGRRKCSTMTEKKQKPRVSDIEDNLTGVIVGHSNVEKLQSWIGSEHTNAFAHPLQICDRLRDLRFLSTPGLMSADLLTGEMERQCGRFDIVVLDCGSEDLAAGIPIQTIIDNLVNFAKRCLALGSSAVVIVSVLPRTRNMQVTFQEFSKNMYTLNDKLRSRCIAEKVVFFRHTGFFKMNDGVTDLPISYWTQDGVHPSPICYHKSDMKSGMEKYARSIRSAVHRGLQWRVQLKQEQLNSVATPVIFLK